MNKKIKGALFVEYVGLIKDRADIDWGKYLVPSDLTIIEQAIVDSQWYPFESFERIVVGIVTELAKGDMQIVRGWGRSSIDRLKNRQRFLISDGNPMESLMRDQVRRHGEFNFNPIRIRSLVGGHVEIEIALGSCETVEQEAAYSAQGYFERVLELSGARDVHSDFKSKLWCGDPNTILEILWSEVPPGRMVRGDLFVDYVRMIKSRKDVDWSKYLLPDDMRFLNETITNSEWYPFDTFERMGVGIITEYADKDMQTVRLWGRTQVNDLIRTHKDLICEGDAAETLMRYHVLRKTFFNFSAVDLAGVDDGYAKLRISYNMSRLAEEAATYQTLGFFEGLLTLSGATDIRYKFASRLWEGDAYTILEMQWRSGTGETFAKVNLIAKV